MEELDLKELISMFLEKKLLIILVIIIFAIMGAIYTLKFIVPEYEASISLVLVQLGTEATTDSATSISAQLFILKLAAKSSVSIRSLKICSGLALSLSV